MRSCFFRFGGMNILHFGYTSILAGAQSFLCALRKRFQICLERAGMTLQNNTAFQGWDTFHQHIVGHRISLFRYLNVVLYYKHTGCFFLRSVYAISCVLIYLFLNGMFFSKQTFHTCAGDNNAPFLWGISNKASLFTASTSSMCKLLCTLS